MVKGDDVDVASEFEHSGDIRVVADLSRRQRCRHSLGLGENPQVESKFNRAWDHHSGQLASANNADDRSHP